MRGAAATGRYRGAGREELHLVQIQIGDQGFGFVVGSFDGSNDGEGRTGIAGNWFVLILDGGDVVVAADAAQIVTVRGPGYFGHQHAAGYSRPDFEDVSSVDTPEVWRNDRRSLVDRGTHLLPPLRFPAVAKVLTRHVDQTAARLDKVSVGAAEAKQASANRLALPRVGPVLPAIGGA